MKKAGLISGSALASGAIAAAVSGGAVPVLAASGSAFVTALVVDQTHSSPPTDKGNNTVNNCAPTNFFDIVEALITQASWWLLLLVGIPMFLGWLIPGPLARIRKGRK